MSKLSIVVAVIAAVVFAAAGYLVGVEVTGQGPSTAVTEKAVKDYLAANPDLLVDQAPPATLSEGQLAEVEATVRTHLIANPEIIRDAIAALQAKEQEAEREAQIAAIADHRDALFSSDLQFVLGNPDGDVTLVEFFDYNCGYCRRAHEDMNRLIAEDENLRVVIKEFPVLGDESVEAAQISVAVKQVAPDRIGEFYDALLMQPGRANADVALAIADDMGLDVDAIREQMDSEVVNATISEAYELANALALTGTPSYVTTNDVMIGAVGYDALKEKIESARENCDDQVVC